MKRSKYRDNKQRNSSRSTSPQSLKQNEKSHVTIEELLKQVLSEKKLVTNDQVLFCAKRELVNHLMKTDLA